ncbi:unnamed protein product, partial [Rotaria sp. Silwood2]
MQLLLQPPMCP